MESFIVSARKYRPTTFDTVVGQQTITSTLKNAIKTGQLAQAFLFCGPRGVGKTTCARILAKTINCQNITENYEPCNACPSCKSFNEQTSFNIHELDAASNNSVDDIRALIDQVRIPPQVGKYKVYIIDEVHMLSQQAFNAFLKTLEEPPSFTKFILATTEKNKILPTILSRCQIFDFKRITIDDMAKHLAFVAKSENISAEEDALHLIAQKADGSLRDALSIFDQIAISTANKITYQSVINNLNILDYDYYFRMTEIVLEKRTHDALNLIDEIIENGFEGNVFLAGFASHMRNLLLCKNPASVKLLEVSENIKNKYLQQSTQCPEKFIINCLDIASKFEFDYKNSNHKRLHLELAFIKMCNPDDISSAEMDETVNIEKKKIKQPLNTVAEPSEKNIPKTAEEPNNFESTKETKKATLSLNKIISLKDENIQEPAQVNEVKADYGKEPVTLEKLQEAWTQMATHFSKQPSFFIALNKRQPELDANGKFVFFFDNNLLSKEFVSNKAEIMHLLRSMLNNSELDVYPDVATEASSETVKPYTPEEKLKKMIEKKPDLKKLKDQLDLEIEY